MVTSAPARPPFTLRAPRPDAARRRRDPVRARWPPRGRRARPDRVGRAVPRGARRRRAAADRPPPAAPHARHGRHARPPAAAAQRGRRAPGLHLLDWLERYIFPLERGFDEATAERLAPAACRAFAAAGTTTAVIYGAVYEPSLERGVPGGRGPRHPGDHRQGDDGPRDATTRGSRPSQILDISLRQSADLCSRWHGADDGRLQYAFTPRFAITCSPEMLRESAALAAADRRVLADPPVRGPRRARRGRAAVPRRHRLPRRLRPRRRPRGADDPGPRDPPLEPRDQPARRDADGASPTARRRNLFLSSGAMPLSRYLAAGIRVGLGSDVPAGPELSIFANMRAGAYTQSGLHVLADGRGPEPLDPLDWLRLATLGGARALGLDADIGSLEAGKEADLIAVDPRMVAPVEGDRLGRPRRDHVAGSRSGRTRTWSGCAWVRGRAPRRAAGRRVSRRCRRRPPARGRHRRRRHRGAGRAGRGRGRRRPDRARRRRGRPSRRRGVDRRRRATSSRPGSSTSTATAGWSCSRSRATSPRSARASRPSSSASTATATRRSRIPSDLRDFVRPQRGPRRAARHRVRLGDRRRATSRATTGASRVNVACVVGSSALRIAALGWDDVQADDAAARRTSGRGSARRWRTGAFGLSTGPRLPARRLRDHRGAGGDRREAAARLAGSTTPTSATRWATGSWTRSGRRSRSGGGAGRRSTSRTSTTGRRSRARPSRCSTLVDDARADGQDVTFDLYPSEWASTRLLIMLPTWIQAGGVGAAQGAAGRSRRCATGSAARCGRAGACSRADRAWDELRLGA